MKKECDLSNAGQAEFFRPVGELEIPIYLDQEVKVFFAKRALAKKKRLGRVVNAILRKEMEMLKKS